MSATIRVSVSRPLVAIRLGEQSLKYSAESEDSEEELEEWCGEFGSGNDWVIRVVVVVDETVGIIGVVWIGVDGIFVVVWIVDGFGVTRGGIEDATGVPMRKAPQYAISVIVNLFVKREVFRW